MTVHVKENEETAWARIQNILWQAVIGLWYLGVAVCWIPVNLMHDGFGYFTAGELLHLVAYFATSPIALFVIRIVSKPIRYITQSDTVEQFFNAEFYQSAARKKWIVVTIIFNVIIGFALFLHS